MVQGLVGTDPTGITTDVYQSTAVKGNAQAFFTKQKSGTRNRPTEQSELTRNGGERHPVREERDARAPWHSSGKTPLGQHGLGLVREVGARPKRLFCTCTTTL